MLLKKIILPLIVISSIGLLAWKNPFAKKDNDALLYRTENPTIRTIKHTVSTSGVLEIKEIMHVGSIQPGFVKDIYVKENQRVTKGKLLALIDTAKNDTDVQAAQHRVLRAEKELEYQKAFFARQEALYNAKQLSLDSYQKVKKELEKTVADLAIEQALLRKSSLEFESTKIKAPEDGVIIAIYATKGMIANDISNIVLFDIAQDATKMKVVLDIDESDIGHVKPGKHVSLVPNSFPDMKIRGTIHEVSFMQKAGTTVSGVPETSSYKATINIDNTEMLLRPGMIVNAKIRIGKVEDVLSISGLAFYINHEILKKIAHRLHFQFQPIDSKERYRLSHTTGNNVVKYVWIIENKKFIQKAVTIGLSDSIYWEIKTGLTSTDNVIIDIEEVNDMDEIYNKIFKGSL